MVNVYTSNLGYPRIGKRREWKKALESHWSGKIEQAELEERIKTLRHEYLHTQVEKGVDLPPVGDFTYYDHVLDTAVMFGLIPKRFGHDGGPVSLDTYFAMARGNQKAVACEMTKWFDTNYHYIVPEWEEEMVPTLLENRPLRAFREAKRWGINAKPVILGPFTFLKLAKGFHPDQFSRLLLDTLTPLYAQVLQELEAAGADWIQLDEPAFVTDVTAAEMEWLHTAYSRLADAAPGLRLLVQTYFDSVSAYSDLIRLPVHGIGLDLVYGREENLASLQKHGFPEDKVLALGLIDGRNIWKTPLQKQLNLLEEIREIVSPAAWMLQPSCSLLHVPVDAAEEQELPSELAGVIAFAHEKLDELSILKEGFLHGQAVVAEVLQENAAAIETFDQASFRRIPEIRKEIANLTSTAFTRSHPFAERQEQQEKFYSFPLFPTTTIGSFPQSPEVRRARKKWRTGEWSEERYREFVQKETARWIGIQEEIGLDVLVHGEFERTDMVEYFSDKLTGFSFTKHGWVQSYGSRCVKPPIIHGDVAFHAPMTAEMSSYAQSLTEKKVKGMLTGPTTMIRWSFVRDDLPESEVALQIGYALRQEVDALESSGIAIIQVDEPALREGLPLKKHKWKAYLDQAVRAFRLATSSVQPQTQIHTHMCYSEFHDIIDAIQTLDADVISIESSRSHGELIHAFEEKTYPLGIGLGVYDIHSPRIPTEAEMLQTVERALRVLPPTLFWINPDCGLKTRREEEVVASLQKMVQVAQAIRQQWQKTITS
ncbi:5-methyltetrahydropteroyltriglutamate--homocysteine S-methyltransferase [Desmospora activa]|uniref:5-methyltetrahydropteroyltriglutamate--homocysteine methyltransferase n=1 Tax=Desmospora activa DSM 45169 TaxID=1121389 RepID=A0A2T4ZCI9_9BACL|nr:5-methyltetrahydropteroyltriglutamate--homocysteine S-methyltransferase [Desmospora activa]PTM59604.1 methionine synthase (B12-independent) [Desmospora activa DSM 45169]